MNINFYKKIKNSLINISFVQKIAKQTLEISGFKQKNIELTVFLVGAKRIRTLNREFRGKDKATDVLSFSQIEGEKIVLPKNEPVYLGDIFICDQVAKKQAKALGHSLKKELAILLIHGFLHLTGYDHETDNDFNKMNKIEQKVFKKIFND